MGDISAEPSMEDILSSIKRIIAEEGDSAVSARPRRAIRSTPSPTVREQVTMEDDADGTEVLELSDRVVEVAASDDNPQSSHAEPRIPADAILSENAAQASRGAFDSLSRLVVKPSAPQDAPVADTLEGLVREMLRPMLREWLDAKLPGMVEAMVAKEIARITQNR